MTSFCIQAFLVIVFLTASAVTHLRRNRAPRNRGERFLDALRAVLPTFYWSSVLLSLGITVASLKARALEATRRAATAYEATRYGELSNWRVGEKENQSTAPSTDTWQRWHLS